MLSVFFFVAALAGCFPGGDFLDTPRHVFDVVGHDSEKGTDKGEKKAGNLDLSHVLWLTLLPVQVSSLRLAAAAEAALVGILKPVGC